MSATEDGSVESKDVVFLFSTHDVSTAQGTTEAYYVSKFFASRCQTHVFAPISRDVDGTNSHRIGQGGLATLLIMNVILFPWLAFLTLRHRPTVIYAYRNVIIPPLLASIFSNATVVYDLRVDPYEQPKEFNPDTLSNRVLEMFSYYGHRLTLREADVVFVLSEPLCESVSATFDVPSAEIDLVPLGVDTDHFSPVTSDNKSFRVAYLGSIVEFRDIESVIRALNALEPEVQRQIVFDLFGSYDDEYRATLEAVVDGQYTVNWHGFVPHRRIPDEVGACDCAVSPLPPLSGFEVSSPAKVYEYLALGLPVVATDITPHCRILEDRTDSILFEPGDYEAIGDAFTRLVKDEDRRREMARAARAKGLKHDWAKRFATIIEAIEDHRAAPFPADMCRRG